MRSRIDVMFKRYNLRGVRLAFNVLRDGGAREPRCDAEDAVAEAWMYVATHPTDSDEHLRALFFRCVRFRAIMLSRRNHTRDEYAPALLMMSREEAMPGWGAHVNDSLALAADRLLQLPARNEDGFQAWLHKDVFKLTLAQTREELQVSHSTLNSQLARARAALRSAANTG